MAVIHTSTLTNTSTILTWSPHWGYLRTIQNYYDNITIKCVQKITSLLNFCFADISASVYWIFKILVPTPHNIPLIMGGRHKNFTNPINRSWDMSKTKIQSGGFFAHPLSPVIWKLQNGSYVVGGRGSSSSFWIQNIFWTINRCR